MGELADIAGLSSAALSQHLGKMRALKPVGTKRDGQTIYYRLASREVREVLETLYRLYCQPKQSRSQGVARRAGWLRLFASRIQGHRAGGSGL